MVGWLMLSLTAGLPTGFGIGDLDRLVADVAGEAHLLVPALQRRVQDVTQGRRPALARDNLDLVAPLAERVGLASERAALEDASFRSLEPVAFAALSERLPDRAQDEEDLATLQDRLEGLFPEAQVAGRVKSLWSTQKKMRRKGIDVHEVHDRLAFRVLLPDEAACYDALERLVGEHEVLDGELDDYIAQPKGSGYRALHVALEFPMGERRVTAEVQLKTPAMHHEAEFGAAAHWRYKLTA